MGEGHGLLMRCNIRLPSNIWVIVLALPPRAVFHSKAAGGKISIRIIKIGRNNYKDAEIMEILLDAHVHNEAVSFAHTLRGCSCVISALLSLPVPDQSF